MIDLEELLAGIAHNIKERGIVNCVLDRYMKYLNLGINEYVYHLNINFSFEKGKSVVVNFITWDETEVKIADVSLNCNNSLDVTTTSYRYFDLNETEFLSKVSSSLNNVYYIQRHYSELKKINYQNKRKEKINEDFV